MKKIFEATGPFVFKAQKLVDRVSKIAKDKFNLENKIKEEGTDTTVYMIKCTYKNDGIKSFIENVIKKDGEATNADKLLEAWKAAINDQIFKKADKDNLAYIKYFDGGFGLCYVNKGLAQDIANNLNDNTIISISEVSATSVNSNNIERFKSSGVSSLDVAKMDQAVLKIAEDNYAKYIKGLEDAKAKADADAEKLRKEGTETEVYAVKWKFNKDQLIKQVKKCAEELKSSGDLKADEVIKKWTDEYYNKIMQIAVDNNLICIRNNKDLAVDLCFDTTSEAEPFFNKVKGINTCGSFDDIKKIKVNSSLIADFNKSAEFEANESVATIIKQVADESQDKFMQELAKQAEEDAEKAEQEKRVNMNKYDNVLTITINRKKILDDLTKLGEIKDAEGKFDKAKANIEYRKNILDAVKNFGGLTLLNNKMEDSYAFGKLIGKIVLSEAEGTLLYDFSNPEKLNNIADTIETNLRDSVKKIIEEYISKLDKTDNPVKLVSVQITASKKENMHFIRIQFAGAGEKFIKVFGARLKKLIEDHSPNGYLTSFGTEREIDNTVRNK